MILRPLLSLMPRNTLRAVAVATMGSLLGCAATGADVGELRVQATWPDDTMAKPVDVRDTPSGAYLAGQAAQKARRYEEAATFLKKVIAVEPDNADLARQTFMLLTLEGEFDEAADIAARLIEEGDRSAISRYVLYLREMKQGKWAEASAELTDIPDRSLHLLVGPFMEAWAAAAQGNADAAMAALEPLSKDDNFKATYAFHAAMVNDLLGLNDAAATFYAEAAASPGGLTLRVVQMYGNFLERQGRRDEAEVVYNKLLEPNADNSMLVPLSLRLAATDVPAPLLQSATDGLAEGLFSVGSSLRQQGSQDFGLIFGRMALELRPDFVMARLLVADILERQDRLAEANQVYQGIPEDSPFRWSADLNRAQNMADLGEVEASVEELEQLATTRPERYDALVTLANVLRQDEQFEASAKAMDRAIERITEIREEHWRVFYSRGIALERSKQWARAEADFLKALELQPEQPYVLNYLGYSWVDQGMNIKRATDMIQRAVKLRPNDGAIVDSLGWALYRVGDFPGAVRQLERAVELMPHDPTINDHLGDAYWRVGRQHEARFQWQRALSLEPTEDLLDVIGDKLKNGLKPVEETPAKDG